MSTAHHADKYWGRCSASETTSNCVRGKVCREQEQLCDDQLIQPETWASSSHISISSCPNVSLFPCAPLPTSICYFLSGKSFGPSQSSVPAVPNTSTAKERDSSVLRLHQESWIKVLRMRVSLCCNCRSARLFVLFLLYTSLAINCNYSRSKIQTKHLKITILNLDVIKIFCLPRTIDDLFVKTDDLFIKRQSAKLPPDLRAREWNKQRVMKPSADTRRR